MLFANLLPNFTRLRALVFLVLPSARAQDQAFFTTPSPNAFDTPIESLASLSDAEFTTLACHPLFPNYGVCIKQTTEFCDLGVKLYTGYIHIEVRCLFFYFFESRSEPEKDDVILWINEGPGCSFSFELFMELGPCRILNASALVYHQESWTNKANMLFLDQPIGVGFSYTENGETIGFDRVRQGTQQRTLQPSLLSSLRTFFENFKQFKRRGLHLAGKSYAGRYLPIFTSVIYGQNAKVLEANATPVNLTLVIIGNGLTDLYTMLLSYSGMQGSNAPMPPIVGIAVCVAVKNMLPRCENWLQESCADQFDAINRGAAYSFCSNAIEIPFRAMGRNHYDIGKSCEGEKENYWYPIANHFTAYLSNFVRAKLGVNPAVHSGFTPATRHLHLLHASGGLLYPTRDYVGALLERGVCVLIYFGIYDWICNWVGNERWALELEWGEQETLVNEELREWIVQGKKAGKTMRKRAFSMFATICEAGHVPDDRLKESLVIVNRWLAEQEL